MFKKTLRLTDRVYPVAAVLVLLCLWQIIVSLAQLPSYILPSPVAVIQALVSDFPLIAAHTKVTLIEAATGFSLSVALAFILSIIMDNFTIVKKSFYPILIISQTVPIIALTPILIVWFGFGMLTKVLVIILVCFFPIAVSLVDGFAKVDRDYLNLFRSYGASRIQVFFHLKLPAAAVNFFSGLKIAATYTIMAAVISEWQGGVKGIGVYMVRAKKAYTLDKVFASILVITLVSVLLIYLIDYVSKKVTHWK
ncbi:ABC transporter permease [Paenibacillus pedocola]|uniref:ABC transporter permease n=1 Tax=Paenibacillus pedocola TaxID=3242193 RepID=UPI002877F89F|nr:ABC transporter permease [Paenibacillus typhae]